jgi:glycosyltransferase involved in cell wall biosynthesis
MKPARRVALLFQTLALRGGAENVTIWLAHALASRGYEIAVFSPSYDPALWPEQLTAPVPIHVFPDFSFNLLAKRSNVHRRRLYGRYLSRALEGFDVIIPNNSPAIQWVDMAKRRNDRLGKIIWLCHEPTRQLFGAITDRHLFEYEKYGGGPGCNGHIAQALNLQKKRMARKVGKRARNARWEIESASAASRIVANSHFSARNIKEVFGRDAEVIYPGILLTRGQRQDSHKPRKQNYIGYVGRLSVKKNVCNVVEAFRLLCENGVDQGLSLKIVGDGPRRDALREKVWNDGLQDRVVFLGQLSDDELPEFYARSRLTVYVPIDEPYGLVPLESLYYHTPIIVSDHGGPGEIFTHRENACLVNPFNPVEIANAIAWCLENEEEAERLANRGHDLVASSLTFDAFVDKLEHLF